MSTSEAGTAQRAGVAARFLDMSRDRLGARRWVLCLPPEEGARAGWTAHAAEPELRDQLIARVAEEAPATTAVVDVDGLDQIGDRLRASGIARLLVVPTGREGAAVFEDPEPDAADAYVAHGSGDALAIVPRVWRAESAAQLWWTLVRWLPTLDGVTSRESSPEDAAVVLGELLDRPVAWDEERHAITGLEDLEGGEVLSQVLADVGSGAVSVDEARRNALLRERARIASVIHEGITQVLTNVAIQLDVLDHLLDDPEQARKTVRSSRSAVLEAIDSLRTVIFDLTPAVEEWQDLAGGIERFVADFSSQWGLHVDVSVTGEPRDLDAEVVSVAFAFVQEALTNVRKHTETSTAGLAIAFRESEVSIEVCDEGEGMDPEATGAGPPDGELRSRQGLKIMESRIRLLNGRMAVRTAPGEGTCVRMVVPG